MAEKACRESQTRRSSLRKSLADAGLPSEYLEDLERKRRQLDDSIHKYIAAKEREYKQHEKDIRHRHRQESQQQQQQHVEAEASKRRTSSESTQHSLDSLMSASALDALLSNAGGGKRGSADSQAIDDEDLNIVNTRQEKRTAFAGLTDRRASVERDKDFIGLFTPSFIPALQHKDLGALERISSAPTSVLASRDGTPQGVEMQRANSDTYVQAKPKRPVHLQLSHRTSSSGSSVDGKLVSALKSPTASTRNRRKRVSLAVGDAIVAPADNVPVPLSNNRRASHSRLRSPAPGKDRTIEGARVEASVATGTPLDVGVGLVTAPPSLVAPVVAAASEQAPVGQPLSSSLGPAEPLKGDVGDMWHLEDSDDAGPAPFGVESDSELDGSSPDSEVTGRLGNPPSPPEDLPEDDGEGEAQSDAEADADAEVDAEEHDSAMDLEFKPASVSASHQSTGTGFRRPSVSAEPVIKGLNYSSAAQEADATGIYGSSFSKPTTKASFTGGSLGESFMARHAEEMMRLRIAQEQQRVG